MKLELKCLYPSQFKLNSHVFICLDNSKPDIETKFWVHEIKSQSLILYDTPKYLRIKRMFPLAYCVRVSNN